MNVMRASFGLTEFKLAGSDTSEMVFSGYGAVFGNMDAHGDVIEPGAFADSLAASKNGGEWPSMLLQHGGFTAEDQTPIGVWTDLSEDGVGLRVEGKLADTARGREVHALMKMTPRPAITGLSIGYIPREFDRREKPEDPRRRLKRVTLVEISPVTFPANSLARVTDVKSLDESFTKAEIEAYLRDACGCSRTEAKTLVARISATCQRDAGDGLVGLADSIHRNINTLRS